MALNEQVGEEASQTTTPVVNETATEEVVEQQASSADGAEVNETETGEDLKKGAQARIRELANQKRAAEEEAKSLKQRLAELTGSAEPALEPFTPQVEPGGEISPEQYKQDVYKTADALVTLRLKQQNAVNRITSEASEVMKIYPELDPDSDTFNKELSDTVTEAVEAKVKSEPYTASVKKFVDSLMKPYKGAVAKEVGQATEQIAKQVSEAALRPTSVRKQEKTAKEKSIAELEQELGVVVS